MSYTVKIIIINKIRFHPALVSQLESTLHVTSIFIYRYTDDVLSANKPNCKEYLAKIYPQIRDQEDIRERHIHFVRGYLSMSTVTWVVVA